MESPEINKKTQARVRRLGSVYIYNAKTPRDLFDTLFHFTPLSSAASSHDQIPPLNRQTSSLSSSSTSRLFHKRSAQRCTVSSTDALSQGSNPNIPTYHPFKTPSTPLVLNITLRSESPDEFIRVPFPSRFHSSSG